MALANIKVYRDIKELRDMIYDDVVRLPKHLKFPLGSLIIDGLFVLPKLLSEILHSQSSTHKVATLNIAFHELVSDLHYTLVSVTYNMHLRVSLFLAQS